METQTKSYAADHDYMVWFNALNEEIQTMVRRNVRQSIESFNPDDCWHYYGSPCTACDRHAVRIHRANLIGA